MFSNLEGLGMAGLGLYDEFDKSDQLQLMEGLSNINDQLEEINQEIGQIFFQVDDLGSENAVRKRPAHNFRGGSLQPKLRES